MNVTAKQILVEVPKHPGVATCLRIVEVGGVEYLDIRDIISAAGEVVEGRGYLFPLDGDRSQAIASLGEEILNLGEDRWPR